eukprot:scaffold195068_cov21-Prasinocladus_malaysianus.AAC.1
MDKDYPLHRGLNRWHVLHLVHSRFTNERFAAQSQPRAALQGPSRVSATYRTTNVSSCNVDSHMSINSVSAACPSTQYE